MRYGLANAFKAVPLLQLTLASSLYHLFNGRQFSKSSPDACQFLPLLTENRNGDTEVAVWARMNEYLQVIGRPAILTPFKRRKPVIISRDL